MIDHVVVKASKALFDQTVDFYQKALTPTGYTKMRENPSVAVGFGETMPDFWVFASDNQSNTAHVALRAKDRNMVKMSYDAAIEAGGTDNGNPGLRKHVHENCYAAFVKDPAGNNVEFVCHAPEP